MKIIKLSLSIFLLFLMTGCPDKANDSVRLIIENNSDKEDILVRYNSVSSNLPPVVDGDIVKKKQAELYTFSLPDSDLYVFILSMDTVNKYTWEDIRENNRYMKRYMIGSESDLKKIDYTITYP